MPATSSETGSHSVQGTVHPLGLVLGHPVVVVPDDALPVSLATPRPARLEVGGRRGAVLLHRCRDLPRPPVLPPGAVGLPRYLTRRLGAVPGQAAEVTTPPGVCLRVTAALTDDLPPGLRVHVSADDLVRLGGGRRRPGGVPALLVGHRSQLPVRALARQDLPPGQVRLSMLQRTLGDVAPRETVVLVPLRRTWDARTVAASLRRRVLPGPVPSPLLRLAGLVGGILLFLLRCLDQLVELVLRPLLLAPRVAVRTEQGQIGDDTSDVVRAHPALLAALGLPDAGGQAVLRWGLRRTAVLVVPDVPDGGPGDSAPLHRAVAVTEGPRPAHLPAHLLVRVSTSARNGLGMPAHSAVELRRRLRPLVLRQTNALTTPLVGLVLAAVAIDGVSLPLLVAGAGGVAVLGLAPLRLSRPGRGLWP